MLDDKKERFIERISCATEPGSFRPLRRTRPGDVEGGIRKRIWLLNACARSVRRDQVERRRLVAPCWETTRCVHWRVKVRL